MSAQAKNKPEVIQGTDRPVEDFDIERDLIPTLRQDLRDAGYQFREWSVKEDKKARTITFSAARVPWVQTEIPGTSGPGDDDQDETGGDDV